MSFRQSYIRQIEQWWQAGVEAVSARSCFDRNTACLNWKEADQSDQVYVFGAGKAALAMAGELEHRLAGKMIRGHVVVPHGYPESIPAGVRVPKTIEVLTGGHPVPDVRSVQASSRMLATIDSLPDGIPIFFLLSGGGSALLEVPVAGVSLADIQHVTRALLGSGATIEQLNAVRKQLSGVKGGKLAERTRRHPTRAIVISDVIGDELETIASGPLLPGLTSWKLFREILFESKIADQIPESVKRVMETGLQQERHQPFSPASTSTKPVEHFLIGNLRQAAEGVRRAVKNSGLACDLRSLTIGSEYSDAVQNGRSLAIEAMRNVADGGKCLIWGGETTVTVSGTGTGGRNQEIALSAGQTLFEGESDIIFLSAGTDGVDGPTDAAGAWSDRIQIGKMIERGMSPLSFLKNNDSWSFFDKAGGHLKTGPTHTNVMDLQIALIPPE